MRRRAKPDGDRHAALAVMNVIERRDRRELAVHRRSAPRCHAAEQHDHVLGRAAKPAREIPQLLRAQVRPVIAAQLNEPQNCRRSPAYARTVFGERSISVNHRRNASTGATGRRVCPNHGPRRIAVLHDPLNPAPTRRSGRHRKPEVGDAADRTSDRARARP